MAFKCSKKVIVEKIGENRLLVKTEYEDNSYTLELNSICERYTYKLLYADVRMDRAPSNTEVYCNIIRNVVGLTVRFSTENQLYLLKALGEENLLLVNLLLESGLVLENMRV